MAPLEPWPWYVVGPLIGLVVPALLLVGGKVFGVSSTLRHACAAALPTRSSFFRYDWWRSGAWNLIFVLGVVLGGALGGFLVASPEEPLALAPATAAELEEIGIDPGSGVAPDELISWQALRSPVGWIVLVGGGLLLGFGARWAGGCTSGHAISGLADLQLPSLVAVIGFFAGGLLVTHWGLPWLLTLTGGGS